jgi:predicted PurR-regulated permease PerM
VTVKHSADDTVEPVEMEPSNRLEQMPGGGNGPGAWWRSVFMGALALALGLGILVVAWQLARPIALLVFAIAIAQAMAPPVAWLERKVPRALAIIIVYISLIVFIGSLLWVAIPQVLWQLQEIQFDFPGLVDAARERLGAWEAVLTVEVIDTITAYGADLALTLLTLPGAIFAAVLELLLIIFISIYWLVEAPRRERFVLSLFPEERHGRVRYLMSATGQAMGGFMRGVGLTAVAVGILTYIGLLVIGVEYALVFGLLAGLLEVVPILGPILAAIPILVVAFLQSPTQAIIVLVFLVVLQQIESHILFPNIVHTQTQISPLLIVVALLVGGTLAGLVGALAAVPLAAALVVLVEEVVAPAVRDWTTARSRAAFRRPQRRVLSRDEA